MALPLTQAGLCEASRHMIRTQQVAQCQASAMQTQPNVDLHVCKRRAVWEVEKHGRGKRNQLLCTQHASYLVTSLTDWKSEVANTA